MSNEYNTVRWVVAGVLGLFFVGVAAGNLKILFEQRYRGSRTSLVPILGGVFGTVAVLISPVERLHSYWWVPLFADVGCFYYLGWGTLYRLIIWIRPQKDGPEAEDSVAQHEARQEGNVTHDSSKDDEKK